MRVVATTVAAAGVVLLAAACGRSSGSHVAQLGATATRTTSAGRPGSALAFSRCMRSHDVSRFPDPDSNGAIPKVDLQHLGVSGSRLQAAQSACGHLLRPTDVQVQQTLSGMVDFAHCMRSHGVRNWPDPTTDGDGEAVFDLRGRIDPDTPQMDTESGSCAHLLQPAPGQDGTVLCNGIGETGCHHYG